MVGGGEIGRSWVTEQLRVKGNNQNRERGRSRQILTHLGWSFRILEATGFSLFSC